MWRGPGKWLLCSKVHGFYLETHTSTPLNKTCSEIHQDQQLTEQHHQCSKLLEGHDPPKYNHYKITTPDVPIWFQPSQSPPRRKDSSSFKRSASRRSREEPARGDKHWRLLTTKSSLRAWEQLNANIHFFTSSSRADDLTNRQRWSCHPMESTLPLATGFANFMNPVWKIRLEVKCLSN